MRRVGMSRILLSTLLTLVILFAAYDCYSGVPHLVNYQGKLTNKAGAALTGTYSITFKIYDAETGGAALWTETQGSVSVQNGIFNVLLGSVTALDPTIFDQPDRWLGIKVGTDSEMTPRQRIASAAYAIKAEKAEDAEDANTISNIGASATPTPNKLLPLDGNAKLPSSVLNLKVYDSGWFSASGNTTYTKTHNLGTTKVLVLTYFSTNSDGSGFCSIAKVGSYYEPYGNESYAMVCSLSTTQIQIRTAPNYFLNNADRDANGNAMQVNSGYLRIVMLALE